MQSHGFPDMIHVKGKGELETYFLERALAGPTDTEGLEEPALVY